MKFFERRRIEKASFTRGLLVNLFSYLLELIALLPVCRCQHFGQSVWSRIDRRIRPARLLSTSEQYKLFRRFVDSANGKWGQKEREREEKKVGRNERRAISFALKFNAEDWITGRGIKIRVAFVFSLVSFELFEANFPLSNQRQSSQQTNN